MERKKIEKLKKITERYSWYKGKPIRIFIPKLLKRHRPLPETTQNALKLKLLKDQYIFRRKNFVDEEKQAKNEDSPLTTGILPNNTLIIDLQETNKLPFTNDNLLPSNCEQKWERKKTCETKETKETKISPINTKNLSKLLSLLKKLFLGEETQREDFQMDQYELRILTELLIRKNRKKGNKLYFKKKRQNDRDGSTDDLDPRNNDSPL